MDWLNIDTKLAGYPAFCESSDPHVATWLKLMLYCGKQENGGRIKGGWNFKQSVWNAAGVRVAIVRADSRLWVRDGDDILVLFYPLKQEKKAKKNRVEGRRGGLARAAAAAARAAANASNNPSSHPSSNHSSNPSSNPSTKGKGSVRVKEEEGKWKADTDTGVPSEREFLALFATSGLPEEFLRGRYAYIEAKGMWRTPDGLMRPGYAIRSMVIGWFARNREQEHLAGESEKNSGAAFPPPADFKTVEQRSAELMATPDTEGAP